MPWRLFVKTVLPLLIMTLPAGCQKPFEFKTKNWSLVRIDLEESPRQLIQIDGDTMKVLFAPYLKEDISLMELTKDSVTLPNPCVDYRVGYTVNHEDLILDSLFRLSPVNHVTSDLVLESTSLKINLNEISPNSELVNPDRIDFAFFVGKSDSGFNSFFTDSYKLKIDDTFVDSVTIQDWFEHTGFYERPQNIAVYADKDFEKERLDSLIEFVVENTFIELVIFEGYFSPNDSYFLKLKKRPTTTE